LRYVGLIREITLSDQNDIYPYISILGILSPFYSLFPSILLDSLSVSFPLFYTFPHFPHRMHRQPILVQFYHPQNSIVSSILLLLFCHRASLINSTRFIFRHKHSDHIIFKQFSVILLSHIDWKKLLFY